MWGDMPAIDILDIGRSEGKAAKDRDSSAMCVASGDLHNMVKTAYRPPKDYTGNMSIVMNDVDLDISAHNAILLITAFSSTPSKPYQP
jgi:hypothetical protein